VREHVELASSCRMAPRGRKPNRPLPLPSACKTEPRDKGHVIRGLRGAHAGLPLGFGETDRAGELLSFEGGGTRVFGAVF